MHSEQLTRRSFLQTMSATAILTGRFQPRNRPNIVMVVVDDLGTSDAGCYGNPVIKTPGLDLLAQHGTRFTHGFCTTASCSASRSVILTGLHNHANGQYGHMHDFHHFKTFDHVQSLPVLLQRAGYRTIRTGKYHVAPPSVYVFEDEIVPEGSSPLERAEACAPVFDQNDSRPFFLYFCTNEPHRPFVRDGSDPVSPEEVLVPDYLPDIPETRAELARYYMSVQRADRGLSRLIELLQQSKVWDQTIVVFISDNGIAFPGAKTTLYEPGMRLPCVIRRPDISPGICDAMITWADLTPTLLDLAGMGTEVPAFHGRSFKDVMVQSSSEGWDEVFASHTFHEVTMYYPMRVVRGRRYKLIWNIAHGLPYPFATDLQASETWQGTLARARSHYGKRPIQDYLHRPKFELYDLEQDPHEVQNLAGDSNYQVILEDFQARLRTHQQRTGDPWILKWEYE
ncbi:MAG: sulfatase [Rhodothermaceae bacterium]|nr:sulfatase [Rhodothermaceae bacterium]MXZ57361.1 sulfatase [Rhodothermaceae bacterium]MYB90600.1 sulfatase [Rhodothermaceae bacterium]MYD68348.1 sulfatase [Rhodothermaceae bacterium]MYG44337.1 sulfatase [Rhodothermaceae bacterium]